LRLEIEAREIQIFYTAETALIPLFFPVKSVQQTCRTLCNIQTYKMKNREFHNGFLYNGNCISHPKEPQHLKNIAIKEVV